MTCNSIGVSEALMTDVQRLIIRGRFDIHISIRCPSTRPTFREDKTTVDPVKRSIDHIEQSMPAAGNSWLVRRKETGSITRSLKVQKSQGHDGVSNWLLKQLPRKNLLVVAKIFSACLKLCYFPAELKFAIVVAIPKPKRMPLFHQTTGQSVYSRPKSKQSF